MNDLMKEKKTQGVRLIDVFAIGPLMVYGGVAGKSLPDWARAGLFLSGVATIGYNGSNYLLRRDEMRMALEKKAESEGE